METAATLAGIQPDDEFYTPPHTQTLQDTHKKKKILKYEQAFKTSVHKHTQPLRALTCSPKHDVHELENILFS